MSDYNLGIGSRIEHPKYGKGVVVEMDTEFYSIWFKDGNSTRGIARDYEGMTVLEKTTADVVPITLDDIKRTISLCLRHRLRRDPMESINSGEKIDAIFEQIFSTI